MRSYVQSGSRMDYSPDADVFVDQVVVLGGRIGVAVTDIPAGNLGALAVSGVFQLPAVTGEGFLPGEELFWDASVGKVTKDKTGDKPRAGYVFAPKAASVATVDVKID